MFMEAGRSYKILVKYKIAPTMKFKFTGATRLGAGRLRLGVAKVVNPKDELDKAIELTKAVDQAITRAGLIAEWESESYDRDHMHLPPGSDELIAAVTAVNPNTAIVV